MNADFRVIPLGDIDLQCEIRLDVGRNVVDRWCERTTVRRVYAAKIEGRSSDMTVAMYEGHSAEEVRSFMSVSIILNPHLL